MTHESEDLIQAWLDVAWSKARRVLIFNGGETDLPIINRQAIEAIEDSEVLRLLQKWTTSGRFTGDICRCPGDLTLALFDEDNSLVGSVSVHENRLSWERTRFRNDLVSADIVELRLLFSRLGIRGSSRALLSVLISALGLHEGDVQFRASGDPNLLIAHRVPPSLALDLLSLSGQEAGTVDQDNVQRMARQMIEMEGGMERAARQLLSWLGSATWPGEAIAGDGALARRILDEFDDEVVMQLLPRLVEGSEVMGAVAWAAFHEDDAAIMTVISPAVLALLNC